MKTVIVEDSRLARNELKELLKPHTELDICGEAENIEDAEKLVRDTSPDLLFLDIHLPDGTAFDLLQKLEYVPRIVFTTAYDEYAIEAFEVNALDYLLKPIRQESIDRALARIQKTEKHEALTLENNSRIFVKSGDRCFLIELAKIRLIASCGNYAELYFENEKVLIYKTMTKIEQRLPSQTFLRISRQYIVNINFIDKIESWPNGGFLLTTSDGKELEASRRCANKLRSIMSL